ncbi:S-adenosyl-L-methionine-dependent methyltransferase [Cladorrhinum sp. PSN259]|nr:S-adenosyl-L-methionine-dependent methyltransferase [Cladorrhinum sp. PSN259]
MPFENSRPSPASSPKGKGPETPEAPAGKIESTNSPKSEEGPPPGSPGNALVAEEPSELEPDETEADSVFDDGDSAFASLHSSTTSLRDELILEVKEHGRQYQGYMEAKYVLPMDEQELERLDFQCHLVWLTLDKQWSTAPLNNIQRALDVGCGTGLWTIEFADEHPEAEVLGVDLAPVQPQVIPPNLMFEVDDLEQPWNFTQHFDYIHCQLMIGAFQDWPKFFRQSHEFLTPNGITEVHDIDFVIRCDDGSLPPDSALLRWNDLMHEAAKTAGFPLDIISTVPELMKDAGYQNVVSRQVKWPINMWPRDAKHKELGKWAHENFSWGCESMSLALFTRVLGWSADEVRVFMALVRKDLKDRRIHAYWNFWIVYGSK